MKKIRATAMVYRASTLSLAALETFVHRSIADAGNLLVAIGATLPETRAIERWKVEDLPANWRDYPAPAILAELGDEWARLKRSAVLLVPSVVIPNEENVLPDPEHPRFEEIEIGRPRPFAFDPRMWKT